LLWDHIAATDQDIFTKFGDYVANWVLQRVELSKYGAFKNPKWWAVAILD